MHPKLKAESGAYFVGLPSPTALAAAVSNAFLKHQSSYSSQFRLSRRSPSFIIKYLMVRAVLLKE